MPRFPDRNRRPGRAGVASVPSLRLSTPRQSGETTATPAGPASDLRTTEHGGKRKKASVLRATSWQQIRCPSAAQQCHKDLNRKKNCLNSWDRRRFKYCPILLFASNSRTARILAPSRAECARTACRASGRRRGAVVMTPYDLTKGRITSIFNRFRAIGGATMASTRARPRLVPPSRSPAGCALLGRIGVRS